MSSPLSAVFAVRQARGAPAPPKESSDPAKWEKGGVLCGKAKARRREKRAATQQLYSRESERHTETERERGGGCWNNAPSAAGAVAKALCVCVCVVSTFFFVLIELICCLLSAASLTHS